MIRDSITILKGIPKLFVNRDKNKNTIFFVSPAENSKPPSGGTITTDRCLTHIRDAMHTESNPPGSSHAQAEAQTATCIPKTAAQTVLVNLCLTPSKLTGWLASLD